MMNERRTACIIVSAAPGHVRAARGLIGRAIRSALKVPRWDVAPHCVHYINDKDARELTGVGDPRYLLEVNNWEMRRIEVALSEMAAREGWTCPPTDIYHD